MAMVLVSPENRTVWWRSFPAHYNHPPCQVLRPRWEGAEHSRSRMTRTGPAHTAKMSRWPVKDISTFRRGASPRISQGPTSRLTPPALKSSAFSPAAGGGKHFSVSIDKRAGGGYGRGS